MLRNAISRLCDDFLLMDADARNWRDNAHRDGELDLPGCREMSRRFIAFLTAHGYGAQLVRVEPPGPEPWYGEHYFATIGHLAVDWTAKQFHNVPGDRADWLDIDSIACPLVFRWPGTYPLDVVSFVEIARTA